VAMGSGERGTSADGNGDAGRGPVFRGVTHLSLDAKGRLAIPARHRDVLVANGTGRLVLTADPSRCLLVYPVEAWEPIQARLMGLSSFNDKIRNLQRLLVGQADDVVLDGSGRILVPHRFELWGHAQWQAQTAQAIAFEAGALPAELDGFSL